jgi:D-lactate dehydrogenase (cytochrome)
MALSAPPFEVVTDPEVLAGYLTDASNLRGHADGLLRPRTAQDVSEMVGWCQAHAIPLTVTARRTSTTGAPVPCGGWLLSMEHLDTVESIGHDAARAQGGVLLGALQDAIEATGRYFPPDPTSRHECTLGAAIACNASGARSYRYGPIRPWVTSLQVVLPTGELREVTREDPVPAGWPVPMWTPPPVKSAAGYAPADNLLDLFIGQEGTLGVITAATIRLTDLPEAVFGVLAFFPSVATGLAWVGRARQREPGVEPRCIEWYDAASLDLARAREPGVPASAQAAVWCEQETSAATLDADLTAWWALLEDSDALVDDTVFADDPTGHARLAAIRHAVPAGVNEQVVANGMRKIGTDCAVPDEALAELMQAYADAPVRSVLFGHIGDNHLHLNMLPETPEQAQVAHDYYRNLCRLAVARGGTVSAEHGIGKLKRAHLADMLGPEILASFRALKAALDPGWILGRGTLLAAPETENEP